MTINREPREDNRKAVCVRTLLHTRTQQFLESFLELDQSRVSDHVYMWCY